MNPNAVETTLELNYPVARQVEQTDDYFGTTVSDPYRWMEDVDSAELKTWIDAENELTQSYLVQIPVRETMQRRLTALGLYKDKVDGKAGMLTRAALGAYQKKNGLKVDCWPTAAVLEHMRR